MSYSCFQFQGEEVISFFEILSQHNKLLRLKYPVLNLIPLRQHNKLHRVVLCQRPESIIWLTDLSFSEMASNCALGI